LPQNGRARLGAAQSRTAAAAECRAAGMRPKNFTRRKASINYETYAGRGAPPLSRHDGKAEKGGARGETRRTAKLNARGRPISFPSFRAVAPRELIG